MSEGIGGIYRRGNVWWVRYRHRGKQHRESSGSDRKGVARALLKRRMAEIGRGQFVGPREERVTFEDLARMIEDDYRVQGRKSLGHLKVALKRLRAYFGEDRALDITTNRIRAYVVARQGQGGRGGDGYAPGTIRKDLAVLKRAFRLAVQAGRLSTMPHVPSIRVDDVRETFLSMADVEAIAREIGADLAPLVRFAAFTGWRRTEVRTLRWRQVDFEAGAVRLDPGTTKNRDGRTFPFGALPPLEALLRDQRKRTDAVERQRGRIVPYVFHRDGDPIRSFRRAWNGACKRVGLAGTWFHDLRRTAVVHLERAGVPRSVATKLTGHRTEAIYRRYAIADAAALAEGVEKLARLHESEPAPRDVLPMKRDGASTKRAQSGGAGG